MATPPTRVLGVTPAVGWTSNTTPKTSPTFDVQAGDLIVLQAFSEDAQNVLGTPTWTGTGTVTLRQSIVISGYCTAYLYTIDVTATQTGRTITMARTAGLSSAQWSFIASVWRNHGGLGVTGKANASGAPSLNLATSANSAVIVGNSDWTASSGTRTWRTVNGAAMTETSFGGTAGVSYMCYTGYAPDSGPAGTVTVGMTAPTGQKYSIMGAEVLGTATATPKQGSVTSSWTISTTSSGKRTPKGSATPSTWEVDTSAAGKRTPKGSTSSTWAVDTSSTGKRTPKGSTSSTWEVSGTASGTTPGVATNEGSTSSTWEVSTTSSGQRTPKGNTTSTWEVQASSSGQRTPKGNTTSTWEVDTSTSGERTPKGSTTNTWEVDTNANGERTPKGSTTSGWTVDTNASGTTPTVGAQEGSTTSTWEVSTTSTGKRTPKGNTTSTWEVSTTSSGATPTVPPSEGSTTSTWEVSTTSQGTTTRQGSTTSTWTITSSASGTHPTKGRTTITMAIRTAWSAAARTTNTTATARQHWKGHR